MCACFKGEGGARGPGRTRNLRTYGWWWSLVPGWEGGRVYTPGEGVMVEGQGGGHVIPWTMRRHRHPAPHPPHPLLYSHTDPLLL